MGSGSRPETEWEPDPTLAIKGIWIHKLNQILPPMISIPTEELIGIRILPPRIDEDPDPALTLIRNHDTGRHRHRRLIPPSITIIQGRTWTFSWGDREIRFFLARYSLSH